MFIILPASEPKKQCFASIIDIKYVHIFDKNTPLKLQNIQISLSILSKQSQCNAFVMQISYCQPPVNVPVPASFCFNHKTFYSSLLAGKPPVGQGENLKKYCCTLDVKLPYHRKSKCTLGLAGSCDSIKEVSAEKNVNLTRMSA